MYLETKNKQRESGIEFLKIIGILLVVLSHVTQTLYEPLPGMDASDCLMNLGASTTDIRQIILTAFSYAGVLGNSIFFSCTAWFLLESRKSSKEKILQFLSDAWIISVAVLAAFLIFGNRGQLTGGQILRCILPTTFANNWYLTCYLLFYLLHPWLNAIIEKMDNRKLLRSMLLLSGLYILMNFVFGAFFEPVFFTSTLILWIAVYFIIAYMKNYLPETSSNVGKQIVLFLIGFIGNFILILLTDFTGLKFSFLKDSLRMWAMNCNPFLILAAISAMNLARTIKLKNSLINRIASLSLLIYIIHENLLLRMYVRPRIFLWIIDKFGYNDILLWVILLAILIFSVSAIAAFLYQVTIENLLKKLIKRSYPKLFGLFHKFEDRAIRLH